VHGCIPEDGAVPSEGQEFSILSFCDGSTCVHMPPVQSFAHAYVGNTGPATKGMGCYSGGGKHHGLLPFLEDRDASRASLVNERMMKALTQTTGAPFKGLLQGNFKCDVAGVTCTSFGYLLV
jgi:phosphoribosylamine--glycine ligase